MYEQLTAIPDAAPRIQAGNHLERPGIGELRCGRDILVPYGLAPISHRRTRNDEVGHNVPERPQHEGTLCQIRMRQLELRLVERDIGDVEQIDINRARPPVLVAHAPELLLDALAAFEQLERRKSCLHRRCRIEEGWLIQLSPRRSLIERRDSHEMCPREPCQGAQCLAQRLAALAEIGPEAQIARIRLHPRSLMMLTETSRTTQNR